MRTIKKLITLITVTALSLIMCFSTALADSTKTVTLGADLTGEQQAEILQYFGIYGEDIPTLYINNTDEREHLSDYVPIEQIGTKTYSCSYVSPTNEGGIQVKTANLTWVTSNMIAAAMSTSGVENCDVIAACPFPVSGTGALTGILMAYENATDEELDEDKKDTAMQEMVTTATIGDDIGEDLATLVVNDAKEQVIEEEDPDEETVKEIVDDTLDDYNVELSDEDRELLDDLMIRISELEYDLDTMEETLARVEENAANSVNNNSDVDVTIDVDNSSDTTVNDDSILNNTDDDALTDAEFDATYENATENIETTAQDNTSVVETYAETEAEETESSSWWNDVVDTVENLINGDDENTTESLEISDETLQDVVEGFIEDETESDDAKLIVTYDNTFEWETEDASTEVPNICMVNDISPDTIYIGLENQSIYVTIENTGSEETQVDLDVNSQAFLKQYYDTLTVPANETIVVEIEIMLPDEIEEGEHTVSYSLANINGEADTGTIEILLKEPETITIPVGETYDLTENIMEEEPEWETSDPFVIDVDDGIVTALDEGESYVTVKLKDNTMYAYRIVADY